MITVKDAAQFLGIDYFEDDEMVTSNITRALSSAKYRLKSAIGDDVLDYFSDYTRTDSLLCIYTEEEYDNHTSNSSKQTSAQNHLRDLYETQLRLELVRKRSEAGETS